MSCISLKPAVFMCVCMRVGGCVRVCECSCVSDAVGAVFDINGMIWLWNDGASVIKIDSGGSFRWK